MPRANRFFVPNHVWHITQRCHKKEFLLKFARDRQRWVYWIREASKRFDVSVLNYTVTSNHVHLLVCDKSSASEIPAMVQLVSGRVAQEYNRRKGRKGAFWEDRYHATAVETGAHLWRCLVYMDMNMVRAGVVRHTEEWAFGGYHEIVGNKTRNRILDRRTLRDLLELHDLVSLERQHREMIEQAYSQRNLERDSRWTESVAVGSLSFVTEFKKQLNVRGKSRQLFAEDDGCIVREGLTSYGAVLDPENSSIKNKRSSF